MYLAKRAGKQAIIDFLIQNGARGQDNSKNKSSKGTKQKEGSIQEHSMEPPRRPNEDKLENRLVCLTMLKDGAYLPVTMEELSQFVKDYPMIAQYLQDEQGNQRKDPNQIQTPQYIDSAPIYEQWDKAAKRLLNKLWKHKSAWIFHEPVDPERHQIPDYFNFVKNPMDLGTVKSKLNQNKYRYCKDFLHDINLIFNNCILYNGPEHHVSAMCF